MGSIEIEMQTGSPDRVAVATVLLRLVRGSIARNNSDKTSRTALHASVPVSERASVRRGLVALIDHGVLAMSGEDIGFTSRGRLLLTRVLPRRDAQSSPARRGEQYRAEVATVLTAIARDERFDPQGPIEELESLPARLAVARTVKRTRLLPRWLAGATCLVAVAAAWALR